MIIAHLPIGYLAARSATTLGAPHLVFLGILAGSVAPDLDMLWFLLVDHGSTHHHDYLTHRPVLWAALGAAGLLIRTPLLWAIAAGALIHLALDSIAGQIAWAWPISDASLTLVHVPATQSHWVLSFLLHWTFGIELLVTIFAGILALRANLPRGRDQ